MAERWEYKIIYFSTEGWTRTTVPSDINEKFDAYGAEGWELVGTQALVGPSWFLRRTTMLGILGLFKRRIGG